MTIDINSKRLAHALVKTLAWVMSTAVLVAWLVLWIPARLGNLGNEDVLVYAQAAENARNGLSVYDPLPPPGPHDMGLYYIYPPTLAAGLSLFDLDVLTLHDVLIVANTLSFLAMCAVVVRLAGLNMIWVGGLAGISLVFPPLLLSIDGGNIEAIINLATAAAFLCPAWLAAPLLVLAAAIKINPIWAAGVVFVRAGPSARLSTLVVASALVAVTIAGLGLQNTVGSALTWLIDVAPTLSQGQYARSDVLVFGVPVKGWLANANLAPSFLPLYLLDPPAPGEQLHLVARIWLSLFQFIVPAIVLVLTRHRTWREQAACGLTAAVLAAPILRGMHIYPLLILPAVLLGSRASTRSARDGSRL